MTHGRYTYHSKIPTLTSSFFPIQETMRDLPNRVHYVKKIVSCRLIFKLSHYFQHLRRVFD